MTPYQKKKRDDNEEGRGGRGEEGGGGREAKGEEKDEEGEEGEGKGDRREGTGEERKEVEGDPEEDGCVFSCKSFKSRKTGLIDRIVLCATENHIYEVYIGERMYINMEVRVGIPKINGAGKSRDDRFGVLAHGRPGNSPGPEVTTTSKTESGNHSGSGIFVSGTLQKPVSDPAPKDKVDEPTPKDKAD